MRCCKANSTSQYLKLRWSWEWVSQFWKNIAGNIISCAGHLERSTLTASLSQVLKAKISIRWPWRCNTFVVRAAVCPSKKCVYCQSLINNRGVLTLTQETCQLLVDEMHSIQADPGLMMGLQTKKLRQSSFKERYKQKHGKPWHRL